VLLLLAFDDTLQVRGGIAAPSLLHFAARDENGLDPHVLWDAKQLHLRIIVDVHLGPLVELDIPAMPRLRRARENGRRCLSDIRKEAEHGWLQPRAVSAAMRSQRAKWLQER
jgi:hypothetical protein